MEPTRPGNDDILSRHHPDVPGGARTPAGTARDDAPASGITACVPFVVQSGRTILMVEASDDGWTLAELDFLPDECVFRESRRVTYTWPREAFGALLSRLAGADIDAVAVERLAADFTDWLGAGFRRRHGSRPARC